MPQDISNYYDPDELRRRQLLAAGMDDPTTSAIMAPDQGDYEAEPGVGTAKPQASAAQQHLSQVLSQQPHSADYQPSRGRRILAAVAGGLTGLGNPAAGVQLAKTLTEQPFQHAVNNWQMSMSAAQEGEKLDEKEQAQAVARQRAGSYEVSSQARLKAANATEAWRQYQQSHMPWQPTTEDQFQRSELGKLGIIPDPQHPGQYVSVKPQTGQTQEQRLALEAARAKSQQDLARQQHGYRSSEIGQREAGLNSRVREARPMTPATPQAQYQAESMATQDLLRTNPEYRSFIETDAKTGRTRVKTAAELPQESSGVLGIGGTSAAQASLAREQYRRFLTELDRRKQAIIGRGQGPQWDLTEVGEEDQ